MKTVFICSSAPASPDTLFHARCAVMRAHRLVATGWRVIVARQDEIAPTVIATCEAYGIPFEVVTSNRRGLRSADKVVAFDRLDVIRQAAKLRIPSYFNGQAMPTQMRLF